MASLSDFKYKVVSSKSEWMKVVKIQNKEVAVMYRKDAVHDYAKIVRNVMIAAG